ncbi:MAG: peptidylprolyl isomerase [Planctomycetes bacterium]|nr:peptidylprolyl isomerase [Planctomycetota bacterium]
MKEARARHILVKTAKKAKKLKQEMSRGAEFAVVAKEHSLCPSGKNGGDLGTFKPGEMVKEFDQVIFAQKLNAVHGPIKTSFGFHLIEILERS